MVKKLIPAPISIHSHIKSDAQTKQNIMWLGNKRRDYTVSSHWVESSCDRPPIFVHLHLYPFAPRSSPLSRNQVLPSSLVPVSLTFSFNKLMPISFSFAMPVSTQANHSANCSKNNSLWTQRKTQSKQREITSLRRRISRLWTGVSRRTSRIKLLLFRTKPRPTALISKNN